MDINLEHNNKNKYAGLYIQYYKSTDKWTIISHGAVMTTDFDIHDGFIT